MDAPDLADLLSVHPERIYVTLYGQAGEVQLDDEAQQIISAAKSWYNAGCSVIPIRADGTKKPLGEWKQYQAQHPSIPQMSRWFDGGEQRGIAVICGKASGGLEMFELEGRVADTASLNRIVEACREAGILWLWERLNTQGYAEWTPSGGLHLLYRITDHEVPGNTKVASRPKTDDELTGTEIDVRSKRPEAVFMTTLAETRGEGGYVIVAPSTGAVHSSGQPWTTVAGVVGVIPEVSWEDRCALHAAVAKALDVPASRAEAPQRPRPVEAPSPASLRVGDDFNARADWRDILDGWQLHSHRGGTEYWWTKPGSNPRDGHHASTGRSSDGDRMYVWSTGTVLPTETPLSKFFVYTELYHNGDWGAATRDLAARGYGTPRTTRQGQPLGDFVPPPGQTTPGERTPQVPPRQYCQTSVGNAERMVDMFGRDFRYVPGTKETTGRWMAWDGKRWIEDCGVGRVNAANVKMTYGIKAEADAAFAANPEGEDLRAAKALRKWFSSSQMDGGMKGTLSQFAKCREVIASEDDFDRHLGWLNLPNGMYDLDNHRLHPHDRSMMFTQLFGVVYDPDATAPKFRAFMETVIPDPAMRAFVQRAIGYTLTGRPNQRALMILWGLKRCGKSQFVELMQALFGDYGYTAMAAAFHKNSKRGDAATPGQHSLRGKRFVSISETDEDTPFDGTALKRFAGTDSVSTRGLYQSDRNWKPQCVIWLATNDKPLLPADDAALWDRVKLAHFPQQFSATGGNGTLKEIPDYAAKLFAEEAPGILNWALEGLKEFQALGGLAEPQEVAESAEAYRREVDPVSQFWDESVKDGSLEEDTPERVSLTQVYQAYVLWCQREQVKAVLGSRRFGTRVRARLGIAEFPRSNGTTWIPGWRWTARNGVLGTIGRT